MPLAGLEDLGRRDSVDRNLRGAVAEECAVARREATAQTSFQMHMESRLGLVLANRVREYRLKYADVRGSATVR